jgi:quaternary ammonium compound-resistance protein SugE
MAWLTLIAAGLIEIVMALSLKYAQGWTRFWPSVIGVGAALGSVFLLAHAVKSLPITTAYAAWTGIGAIGVTVLGIIVFGESMQPLRIVCIAMVFAGIIGLHLL